MLDGCYYTHKNLRHCILKKMFMSFYPRELKIREEKIKNTYSCKTALNMIYWSMLPGWTPLSPIVIVLPVRPVVGTAATSLLRRFFYWRSGCATERGSGGCSISTDEGVRPAAFLRLKTWREAERSGRRSAEAALLQVPGTFGDYIYNVGGSIQNKYY